MLVSRFFASRRRVLCPGLLLGVALASVVGCPPDERDYRIIDVHAHAFNFRSLPMEGILLRYGVPATAAAWIADWLHEATASVTASDASLSKLNIQELDNKELFNRLEQRLSVQDRRTLGMPPDVYEELIDYVSTTIEHEGQTARRDLIEEVADPLDQTILTDYLFEDVSALEVQSRSRSEIDTYLRGLSPLKLVFGILKKALGIPGTIVRYHRMLYIFLSHESEIATYLQDREFPDVDLFVHHMMRLDQVYDDDLKTPVEEQIRRNQELENDTGGKLRFFVAYDPFQLDPSFEDVRLAKQAGALGVKFYPPSGYRPNRMVIPSPPDPPAWYTSAVKEAVRRQYDSRYGRIKSDENVARWEETIPGFGDLSESEAFDAINAVFFGFAHEEELVIFSHHTDQGFQAWRDYGKKMAAPCYWWDVLAREGFSGLRLILAHSGGGKGWFGNPDGWDDPFARQAYNLCVSFENVFCDFGYHDEVLDEEKRGNLREKLRRLQAKELVVGVPLTATLEQCRDEELTPRYEIRKKLLYGSDWMMSVQVGGYRSFVKQFENVLSGDLEDWRGDFFCGNAKRALGLDTFSCEVGTE